MRKIFPVILILLLSGCGSNAPTSHPQTISSYGLPKTRPDPLAERRIVMLEPYSGEKLDAVYFHDGHYDATALHAIDRVLAIEPANMQFLIRRAQCLLALLWAHPAPHGAETDHDSPRAVGCLRSQAPW